MKRLEHMTEPELSRLMKDCALSIECAFEVNGLGEKPLFILHVFNDPKLAQFVSSAHRGDAIKAMRECADRLERKEELSRVHFQEHKSGN